MRCVTQGLSSRCCEYDNFCFNVIDYDIKNLILVETDEIGPINIALNLSTGFVPPMRQVGMVGMDRQVPGHELCDITTTRLFCGV